MGTMTETPQETTTTTTTVSSQDSMDVVDKKSMDSSDSNHVVVSEGESPPSPSPVSAMSTEETQPQPQEQQAAEASAKEEKKSEKDAETDAAAAAASDETKTEEPEETAEEKARKEAELKEKYKDWPMKNIEEPHEHDVLYGRGGGTNHHKGNKRYRKMVEDRKIDYVNSKRLDKPLVALGIIRQWRNQLPPGRFLKLDEKTKKWNDVGDKKAREKTSQALREKAPLIRKKQEEERRATEGGGGALSEDDAEEQKEAAGAGARTKSTRFAEGTNAHDGGREGGITKAVLARDHSLGREYLDPDRPMGLDGFSWQDPFQSGGSSSGSSKQPGMPAGAPQSRISSQGSYTGGGPPPPPGGGFHPDARMGSHGSVGSGIAYRYPSQGSMGAPPPMPHEDKNFRYTTSGRYESWGSGMPPPQMPGYGYPQVSGNAWEMRDHSLGQNPLPHASIGRPAPYPFDGRAPSGQWAAGQQPPLGGYPPPPMSGPPAYNYSGGPPPGPPPPGPYAQRPPAPREYSSGPSPSGAASPPKTSPTSPRFQVDPAVASTWSGQNPVPINKSWSGGSGSDSSADRFRSTAPMPRPTATSRQNHVNAFGMNGSGGNNNMPRPDLVKRATSNQNETLETKPDLKGPSVKRAALNRDSSLVSNQLKAKYLPDYYTMEKMDYDREMRMLSDELEQSTLTATFKPKPLTQEERTSTIDQIAMDLMVKPEILSERNRSSTIDALALDLDDDLLMREEMQRSSTVDEILADLKDPKPPVLTAGDRLSTNDYLEMVNEPIPDDELDLVSGKRQVV